MVGAAGAAEVAVTGGGVHTTVSLADPPPAIRPTAAPIIRLNSNDAVTIQNVVFLIPRADPDLHHETLD
jgi:hypothetical protein